MNSLLRQPLGLPGSAICCEIGFADGLVRKNSLFFQVLDLTPGAAGGLWVGKEGVGGVDEHVSE